MTMTAMTVSTEMFTEVGSHVYEQDVALANKRVLITGSTRGIGRALAFGFARRGAQVIVHGRNSDTVHELITDLSRVSHVIPVGLAVDLSTAGAGSVLVDRALNAVGGIDLVIN